MSRIAAAYALAVVCVIFSLPAVSDSSIDWSGDLEFLRSRAIGMHANLHHSVGRERFEQGLRDIAAMNAPEHQRVVALAELIAMIGDGHSRLGLPLDAKANLFPTHTGTDVPKVQPFGQFPLRLSSSADGYVLTAADQAHSAALGAVLVAVNDRRIDAVVEQVAAVIHHDNDAHKRVLMSSFLVLPEVLHARGVINEMHSARWRWRSADGIEFETQVPAVSSAAEVDWRTLTPRLAPLRDLHPQRKYWSQRWPEANALYVRIREIGDDEQGESYVEFSSRLADQLRSSDARRLVIDLRGNMGGNDSLNWTLVQGLVRAQQFWLPGAMFVITDGATYSAAVGLSTEIEELTPAVFVGSPTGGSPNGYGDSRRLQLPSSGLTVRLSTRYYQGTSYQDKRLAIAPQLPAELSQSDLIEGTDSVLVQILNAADDGGAATGTWNGNISFRELDAELSITLALAADGTLDGVLRIPGVGLAEREFRAVRDNKGDWTGEIVLSGLRSRLSLHTGGDHLRGWLEVNGRPFPLVGERRP